MVIFNKAFVEAYEPDLNKLVEIYVDEIISTREQSPKETLTVCEYFNLDSPEDIKLMYSLRYNHQLEHPFFIYTLYAHLAKDYYTSILGDTYANNMWVKSDECHRHAMAYQGVKAYIFDNYNFPLLTDWYLKHKYAEITPTLLQELKNLVNMYC